MALLTSRGQDSDVTRASETDHVTNAASKQQPPVVTVHWGTADCNVGQAPLQTPEESLQRSPDPLAVFKGPISKGGREERGTER